MHILTLQPKKAFPSLQFVLFCIRPLLETTRLIFALIFTARNKTNRGNLRKTSKSKAELSDFKIYVS